MLGARNAQPLLFPYIKGETAPVERTGALGSTGKLETWQTMANGQRPKLMVQMNAVGELGSTLSTTPQRTQLRTHGIITRAIPGLHDPPPRRLGGPHSRFLCV